jgi:outer membrane lipoprotein-sorting protein
MTSNKLSLTIALAAALAGGCVENDTESLELLVTGGVEGITGLETTVPSNSLPLGSTQTLEAVAKRSDGTLLTLSEVSWSSDNQAIVSVNNTGEITAVSVGTADVSYEYLNQVSTVSIDVTPATMQAIAFTIGHARLDTV